MAAVAQLKALLGMDNAQYKAKMRESEQVTSRMQKSIAGTGRMIASAFSVAAIAMSIRAIGTWTKQLRTAQEQGKLDFIDENTLAKIERFGVAFDKSMLRAKAGVVGLAARLGEAVEDAAAFWGAVSGGGGMRGGIDAMFAAQRQREAEIMRAERLGASSVTDKTAEMERARLAGIQRIHADHARKLADIQKQLDNARNQSLRDALSEQMDVLKRHYAEDVAAHNQATAEKRAALKRELDEVSLVDESDEDRIKRLYDEMKRLQSEVTAPTDPGMSIADREMEITNRQIAFEKSKRALEKAIVDAQTKRDQDRERAMRPLESERERINQQMADLPGRTRGRDVNFDSLARIGGMVGHQRTGLGIADREQQVTAGMQALAKALQQNTEAIEAVNNGGG